MPWEISRQGKKYCVVKAGGGETVACHATRDEALAQMRALYKNVPDAKPMPKSAKAWEEAMDLVVTQAKAG